MEQKLENFLKKYRIPYREQVKAGLKRIEFILDRLNNPQDKFLSIHVGGTNGKGSVVSMLASVFRYCGFKTGVYTSPHLQRITERIRIDTIDKIEEIPLQELIDILFNKIYPIITNLPNNLGKPTEFELLTASAFYYFAQKNIDIAIIEVGLGGRLDATNVLKSPIACIITNIGWDHMDRLGNKLKYIALEKAGIIKPNSFVITGASKKLSDVIYSYAQNIGIKNFLRANIKDLKVIENNIYNLKVLYKNHTIQIPLTGEHQIKNLSIVLKTLEQVLPITGIKRNDLSIWDCIKLGLKNTYLHGRTEVFNVNKSICLLDGAHNTDGAKVLTKFLNKNFKSYNIIMLIGISKDKNYKKMLDYFSLNSSQFICTEAPVIKSLDAEIIDSYLKNKGINSTVIKDYKEAFKITIDMLNKNTILCVCGSLYLIGAVRDLLENIVNLK